MKKIAPASSLLGLALLAATLSACSTNRRTDPTQSLRDGIVLITREDAGHATGFFIDGDDYGCTILTVAHAVPDNRGVQVTTHDSKLFEIDQIQRAENDDLAMLTFEVEGKSRCPYESLQLGNSEGLTIDAPVRMAGYPERAGADRIVIQVPSGKITSLESPPLPNGYAVSYDMTTVGGMSGAPVVNGRGKVIAVHGLTDSEIVSLGRNQQSSSLSESQKEELEAAGERAEQQARINHFKWGIPIQTFLSQRSALLAEVAEGNREDLSGAEALAQEVSDLLEAADALRNQTKYEEALELYEEAVALAPRNTEALYGQGYALVELKQYEEGIEVYDKVVAIDPNYAFAWNNRGFALGQLGEKTEALASYDKATEVDPDYAFAWYSKGQLLNGMERFEDALVAFDRSIELDSTSAGVWFYRGIALERLENYEEALVSYDETIEITPDYANAWSGKGTALRLLGRNEEAIEAYDEAVELASGYADAWLNRGISLHNLGRYEDAIASYAETLELNPSYSAAWNNTGLSLELLGRNEEALDAYEKAVVADSANTGAADNITRLKSKMDL